MYKENLIDIFENTLVKYTDSHVGDLKEHLTRAIERKNYDLQMRKKPLRIHSAKTWSYTSTIWIQGMISGII
jgi:hypothetical protein